MVNEIKTLIEYIESKLAVAGFDFTRENNDLIAWPIGSESDSFYLKYHEPGAYGVVEGTGFFENPGRQKVLQNQIVNWVYEYYSGGAYRYK